MEDCFFNDHWALWISRYAVRPFQQSIRLPSLHQWGLPGYTQSLGYSLHRWHTNFLWISGSTHSPSSGRSKASYRAPALRQEREMWVPSKRVSFLGYIISTDGVAMDNSKLQSMLNWPQPMTVKELQQFLGLVNFYRRFICNFSTITAPLTSLLKGGRQRLDWSPSAQNTFQQLKNRFTTAPILHHPDPDQEFVVEVDASNTG